MDLNDTHDPTPSFPRRRESLGPERHPLPYPRHSREGGNPGGLRL